MAIANYRETYPPRFPPGTVAAQGLQFEERLNWVVEIWPFLESNQIRFDLSKAWDAEGANLNNARMQHRIFRCPENIVTQTPEGYGVINYVGLAGLGKDAARLPSGHPDAGVFGHDRVTRAEEIKDGLSNTLMLIETSRVIGPAWLAGGPAAVRGLDPVDEPYFGPHGQFGSRHWNRPFSWTSTSSALLADCSVRHLDPDIDPKVFQALATIAGGEEMPRDW